MTVDDGFIFMLQVEYMLIRFDHENRLGQLFLNSSQLLQALQQPEFQSPG